MFIGTLYLETQLSAYFQFEFIVIIVGFIFVLILLYGEIRSKRWTWPLSSIFHSLALGNVALLFVWTNNYLISFLTMFIALIGLLRSFAKIDEQEWEDQMTKDNVDIETYANESAKTEIYTNDPVLQADAVIAPQKRRKSRKKSTRKKAKKKRRR